MYNSYTVSILIKVKNIFDDLYEHSVIKAILDCILNYWRRINKSSKIYSFLTEERSYIEDSFVYRIYKKIIEVLNKLFIWTKRIMNKSIKGSKTIDIMNESMNENSSIVGLLGFCVTMMILKILNIIVLSYITMSLLSLVILVAILILITNVKISDILKNSYIAKKVISVFTMDSGGEEWW
ncbi:hypothetical protein PV797_17290 [Clostridiaceae bacterium M8S5]|nr:hypothetical protein PV797_17290 [Clostridiaceae bacterium M8S5]